MIQKIILLEDTLVRIKNLKTMAIKNTTDIVWL